MPVLQKLKLKQTTLT